MDGPTLSSESSRSTPTTDAGAAEQPFSNGQKSATTRTSRLGRWDGWRAYCLVNRCELLRHVDLDLPGRDKVEAMVAGSTDSGPDHVFVGRDSFRVRRMGSEAVWMVLSGSLTRLLR